MRGPFGPRFYFATPVVSRTRYSLGDAEHRPVALLRRAEPQKATQRDADTWAPAQERTAEALRCVRGTRQKLMRYHFSTPSLRGARDKIAKQFCRRCDEAIQGRSAIAADPLLSPSAHFFLESAVSHPLTRMELRRT
ncbi:hypothetical protein EAS61_08285 [Bradyrhizobium zhanjiangense]|uniref:Uncharacterized protein n=1 Tax=Bradyrhizobium zhanjiangense TaxID=1325107 RepID=A0A4Q0QV57_9BRAD|nr:hypothetical protein EAS61_08285 [Bradyrhizobium zhanjiangense]